jgi:GT2 family glycosyltransferase
LNPLSGETGGAKAPAGSLDLGVVIVSFNTRDLLAACLKSLLAEITDLNLTSEVWVVDNASTDASVAMMEADFPTVQVVDSGENLGFTVANNRVLERWYREGAEGPRWVLALNPDAELQPGALGSLIRALEAAPRAAVAGPSLHYADGRFQHAAFRFPGLIQTALDLFPIPRWTDRPINGRYRPSAYAAGRPFAVDFVLGACLLVRGEAMAEVGILDPGYFMYCEEIDWCQRFRAAGWSVLLVPEARVLHHGGASSQQFRAKSLVWLWRSRRRYFSRHLPAWRRRSLDALIRLGLVARAVGDWWSLRRGRLEAGEFAERVQAYRAIVARLEPEGDDLGPKPQQGIT